MKVKGQEKTGSPPRIFKTDMTNTKNLQERGEGGSLGGGLIFHGRQKWEEGFFTEFNAYQASLAKEWAGGKPEENEKKLEFRRQAIRRSGRSAG